MTTIYYDFEATSVARTADMVSVGLVAVTHKDNAEPDIKTFYAEFTDFNINKCDDWVKKNIVDKLELNNNDEEEFTIDTDLNNITCKGNYSFISNTLREWLLQFTNVSFIADFDVIDKPMLIDLITRWNRQYEEVTHSEPKYGLAEFTVTHSHDVGLPQHLSNIPYDAFFDFHSMLYFKGMDVGLSREMYSEINNLQTFPDFIKKHDAHNALFDAYVLYLCHKKLLNS